jgi:hypothetical protein
MLGYVVQLGKISSFENRHGSGLVFKSHSTKTAVHLMLLHYQQFHNIQVRKLCWKGDYELSKICNGLKSQQTLPLGAGDSYM